MLCLVPTPRDRGKRYSNLYGKGRVKRREYLMFVLAIRTLEQDAIDDGIMKPEDITLNAVLRKRFEEIYGLSPYLIY